MRISQETSRLFLSSLRRRVFLSVIAVVLFYLLDAQAFDLGFNTTLKARSQIANHLKKKEVVLRVCARVCFNPFKTS